MILGLIISYAVGIVVGGVLMHTVTCDLKQKYELVYADLTLYRKQYLEYLFNYRQEVEKHIKTTEKCSNLEKKLVEIGWMYENELIDTIDFYEGKLEEVEQTVLASMKSVKKN